MRGASWAPAQPQTPYVDEWPPGTWTEAVQAAYRRLEDAGGIAIDRIKIAARIRSRGRGRSWAGSNGSMKEG